MPDIIQHSFIGKIIGALFLLPFVLFFGLSIDVWYAQIFLWSMFVFGALPDVSYFWGWSENTLHKYYSLTHRYITRWHSHIWCPLIWSYNFHVWLDRKFHGRHGKAYRWWKVKEGFVPYMAIWILVLAFIDFVLRWW